jgi:hypothetical protein
VDNQPRQVAFDTHLGIGATHRMVLGRVEQPHRKKAGQAFAAGAGGWRYAAVYSTSN